MGDLTLAGTGRQFDLKPAIATLTCKKKPYIQKYRLLVVSGQKEYYMSNLPVKQTPDKAITRIRGQAVILDSELAELYGVTVKRLNQQVTRNPERFPEPFVFRLTIPEWEHLRLQNATSNGRGGRRYLPYAFTEHGAIMAATVLNSPQAIQMSVAIVTAFVKLRRMALSVEALARKVNALEGKYDQHFKIVFDAIRQLMNNPQPSKQIEGFKAVKK